MVNIICVEDEEEFEKKHNRYLKLTDKGSIEDEYRRIVESDDTAFKDEMSLKMMKEIDCAVRIGAYGVRTQMGKSCITCLSTGCKLGLVLWYYHDKDIDIMTGLGRAGTNVWQFISKNFDITISMTGDEIDPSNAKDVDLTVDGILYSNDMKGLFDLYFEEEEKIYNLTKEKELEAYLQFASENSGKIYRRLKEELPMKEFVYSMRRNDSREFEDYDLDYHVVNYYAAPLGDYTYRKLPIWFVGRKGSEYEYFETISVKYPTFLELFVYDIVYGDEWEDREQIYYSQMYDEFYALVLEAPERCIVSQYPEQAVFGVYCNPTEKMVTIYDKRQAVEQFHEWYVKTKV